ncbi:unnamed protein product [Ambrosiozyma monospora]|uniref:Unnamed protein product n=1 Tax=Ambrosiozyma monospora TaxID=43982 RepID=A0A9W6YMI4_AMBMO|nr:unnamed protein product [Ambrosiozyma monospora]
MTNTAETPIQIPAPVSVITSNLPVSINFLILKQVIVNHLCSFSFKNKNNTRFSSLSYTTPRLGHNSFGPLLNSHDLLSQVVSLLGYHPDLDFILSMIIQEMELDSTIFDSFHFRRFSQFLFTRSIKLKKLILLEGGDNVNLLRFTDDPNILMFIEYGSMCNLVQLKNAASTTTTISTSELKELFTTLKFVTSLEINSNNNNGGGVEIIKKLIDIGLFSQLNRLNQLTVSIKQPRDVSLLEQIMKELRIWLLSDDSNQTGEFQSYRQLKLIIDFKINTVGQTNTYANEITESLRQLRTIFETKRNEHLNIRFDVTMPHLRFLSVDDLDSYLNLIHLEKFSHTLDFKIWENEPVLEKINMLNSIPNLKTLSIDEKSDIFNVDTPLFVELSNESVANLTIHKFGFPTRFSGMTALKKLDLRHCVLNTGSFDSLPQGLEILSIHHARFHQAVNNQIKLPVGMQSFSISCKQQLPKIANFSQLTQLEHVYVGGELENTLMVNDFISHLPTCLNSLELMAHPPPPSAEPHSDFDLAILPQQLKHLKLLSFPTISGHFPSTLQSLNLDLTFNKQQPFIGFWDTFVKPLTNLKQFETRVKIHEFEAGSDDGNVNGNDVDLRNLEFPEFLCSFKFSFLCKPTSQAKFLIGNGKTEKRGTQRGVSDSLVFFGLCCSSELGKGVRLNVIVDNRDSDNENKDVLESIKERVTLVPSSNFEWSVSN